MPEKKDTAYFANRAAELALIAMEKGHGGPFGAVIVKGGEIVGEGWNQTFHLTDPSAHAEVMAIRDACKRLKTLELAGCTIYSSGEPCPMCMSAIYWTMMDAVVFSNTKEESALAGFDDAKLYAELSHNWKGRAISMSQFPCDRAVEGFQVWMERGK